MKHYDVVIVGAGPAGIFTALELKNLGSKKSILIIEKGKAIEKRTCPKHKTGKCMNCKPCHITTGFSGAGAFSDGKLSLCEEVGGDLPSLVGAEFAKKMIDYTDSIYLSFGADTHIEGLGHEEEKKEIRRNAIRAGLKLVDCPIRHLGTEKAQDIYYAIEQHLLREGVEILFDTECLDLLINEDEVCYGVVIKEGKENKEILADDVIVATGRRGAEWLEHLCAEHVGQLTNLLRIGNRLIEGGGKVMGNENGKVGVIRLVHLVGMSIDDGKIVVVVLLADEAAGILAEGTNLVFEGGGIADKLGLI